MTTPRQMLAQAGIAPKKRYGQNFLQNEPAARKIAQIALAGCAPRSLTLEIGAGTGALTRALIDEGADLTALEIDSDLIAILSARDDLGDATIVQGDALEFDYLGWSSGRPWIVTGNLPYNVATPVMMRLIEMEKGPDSLTVMVQRDVAERIVAAPGTPAYGSLSVAVQFAMHAKSVLTLSPGSFFPPPKVRSSVVRLVRRDAPAVRPRNPATFWKVVRGAFAYRRKTLANALTLALDLDRARIVQALESSNLAPEIRGERLALDDFARLADALAEA